MCTLLVTEPVACLLSVGELDWVLKSTLLVTETVAHLVSVGELAWAFIVLYFGNTYLVLFIECELLCIWS